MAFLGSTIQQMAANKMSQPYYRFDGVDDKTVLDALAVELNSSIKGFVRILFQIKTLSGSEKQILTFTSASDLERWQIYQENGNIYVDATQTDNSWFWKWHASGLSAETIYDLVIVHNGTTPTFYINGVAITGTFDNTNDISAWFADMPVIDWGTLGARRFNGGGYSVFSDITVYNVSAGNLDLSAIEVKELYSGASVPFKYKGASQTNAMVAPADNSYFTNGTTTNWASGGGGNMGTFGVDDTNNNLSAVFTAGGDTGINQISLGHASWNANITIGKQYRASFQAKDTSGNNRTLTWRTPWGLVQTVVLSTSYQTVSAEAIYTENDNFYMYLSGAGTLVVDDIEIIRVGAVAEYDGSGATGAKWYDKSGNNLDGTVSGASLENKLTALDITGHVFLSDNSYLALDNENNNNKAYIGNQGTNASQITFMVGGYGNAYSQLMIDGNGVGIGTTSPNDLLHLSGSNADGNTLLRFGLDGGRDWVFSQEGTGSATTLRLRSLSAKDFMIDSTSVIFRDQNGANEILRVVPGSAGKIGIGTDNIEAKRLHIKEGDSGAQVSGDATLYIEDGSDTVFEIGSPAANFGAIYFADPGSSGAGQIKYAHATDDMTFKTAETSRMFISGSGNVGIGTTAPVAKLHIDDSATGDNKGLYIQNTHNTDGDSAAIRFGFAGNDNANKGGIFFKRTANYGRGSLIFATENTQTDDNVDASDAKLTILADGNVGIGETAPDGKLHILGDSGAGSGAIAHAAANELIVEAQNAGITIMSLDGGDSSLVWGSTSDNKGVQAKWNYNSNAFYFRTSKASAKFILGGGDSNNQLTLDGTNVGIGTTSPSTKLHISGSSGETIRVDGGAGNSSIIFANNQDTWEIYNHHGAGGPLKIYNGGDLVTFLANGKVGIGTTSPDAKLEISVPDATYGFIISNDTGTYINYFYKGSSVDSGYWATRDEDNTTTNLIHARKGEDSYFGVGGGNVGIGTTSPGEKLHVSSTGYNSAGIKIYASKNSILYLDKAVNGWDAKIKFQTAGTTLFEIGVDSTPGDGFFKIGRSDDNADFVMDNTGNVGIGTTAVDELLHLESSTAGASVLKIENTSGTFEETSDFMEILFKAKRGVTTNDRARIVVGRGGVAGSDADSFMAFYTSTGGAPAERMRIDKSGNAIFAGKITTSTGTNVLDAGSGDTHAVQVSSSSSNYTSNIFYITKYAQGASANYNYMRVYNATTEVTPFILKGDNSAIFAGVVTVGSTSVAGSNMFYVQSSGDVRSYLKAGSESMIFRVDGSNTTIGTESSTPIKFVTNNATALTLDTSQNATFAGNVGIGVSSSSGVLLKLKGTGDAIRVESTNSGAGGAQIDLLHFSPSSVDEDVFGVINMGGYYTGTTSVYGTIIKSIWTDVSERRSRLEFYTCHTTVNKVLTLDNSKNATFAGNIFSSGTITSTGNLTTDAGTLKIEPPRDSTVHIIQLGHGVNGSGTGNIQPIDVVSLRGYSIDYSGGTRLTNTGFLHWFTGGNWTGGERQWALTNGYNMGASPRFALLFGTAYNDMPSLGENGALGTNTNAACYWDNTGKFVQNYDATFAGNVKGNTFRVGLSSALGIAGSFADSNDMELGPGYLVLTRDDTADAKQIQLWKNGSIHTYFETTSTGLLMAAIGDGFRVASHFSPADDNSKNLGSSSKRWANLYVADMQMNNEGTGGNEVDGTEGSWSLQEGEDDLFVINRKTGKKFKIKLEAV